ncbi:MAG TPA: alpha/beta fold hydrolase [Microlunatus sp.]|nr:alpha/beta fold hydrolase [Microlunatus sp.]
MRLTAIALASALVTSVLSGCSSSPLQPQLPSDPLPPRPAAGRPTQPVPDVRPQGFADPPPGHGLDRYRSQALNWRDCGSLRCATVLVPLDYTRPDATAITLTVGMRTAHGSTRGMVFTNPGGPGGSGLTFLGGMDSPELADLDLVSWDPRGTGLSTPVRCWGDAEADAYAAVDLSPDDDAERTALADGAQRLGLACLAGSGPLLQHLSSADTARDLDVIRAVLGRSRIDYIGLSNGTLIGAIYAQLFPDRVGRFVLDGAVNISSSPVLQLQGFDRALEAMADWCVAQSAGCRLGTSRAEVIRTITDFWSRLDADPERDGGRRLTQTFAAVGVLQGLYGGEAGYPRLVSALDAAINGSSPAQLLRYADSLLGRRPDGSRTQFTYAYPASRCADTSNDGLAKAWTEAGEEARAAPIFGPVAGTDVECASWPVNAPKRMPLTAPKAPRMIVIGTTGDPATPYAWAQGMARQLKSAVLVTHRGTGHTAFGSACYGEIVRPYLLNGRLPADGTTC